MTTYARGFLYSYLAMTFITHSINRFVMAIIAFARTAIGNLSTPAVPLPISWFTSRVYKPENQ